MRLTRDMAAAAALLGVAAFALLLSALTPLELPELAVPSRIYSRPHRIVPGQSLEASGLVARLRRLGYRDVDGRAPRPGEFTRERRRLVLNRRPFKGPLAAGGKGRMELRLDRSGRIESIRDAGGRRLPSLLLEPEVVGVFHGQRRVDRYLVPLDQVPGHLVDAILAIEDRRFFEHSGLDPHRLLGAFVANLRAGRVVQGGSTLTQQLVKNVFLDDERTLARKLREAWLAQRVERGQSKDEILEAYLNTIYLGQRTSVSVRGVEAAARHYFGKHVQELSLGEAALIAGLIRGPGLYSPYSDPEAALARRNQVLDILMSTERISREEHVQALVEPLATLPEPPQAVSAPYFAARVERELRTALPEEELEHVGLVVYTGLDASLQLLAQRAVQRGLERLEADYPALIREDAPLQAALVALDPRSGEVVALVGGRDWSRSQFDRATQARRQPGSVFKPVVALAAVSRGPDGAPAFTLASLLEDEPLEVETPEGVWTPVNYDGEFRGSVNLRGAIERSINVPVARLGLELGPERIIGTARRLGITSRLRPVPSLALGAFEIAPLEIAGAYSVLAADGVRRKTLTYLRVMDIDGRPLLVQNPRSERSFDPAEVALVTSALRGAVERGTGRGLRARGFRGPVAGKTGTTNDFRDAWFVGYTPELVGAVWVGFDDGQSLAVWNGSEEGESRGLPGSRAALPIFADFITSALGRNGGASFDTPPGIEFARVNPDSGLLAGWGCRGRPELFLEGTAPVDHCGWMPGRRGRRSEPGPEQREEADGPDSPRRTGEPSWAEIFDGVLELIEEVAREAR